MTRTPAVLAALLVCMAAAVPARALTLQDVAMSVHEGQVTTDELRALALAGRDGNARAAQLLAWMLATGSGVRVDLPLAVAWYVQSYADGMPQSLGDARLVLGHLNAAQRDMLNPRLVHFVMSGFRNPLPPTAERRREQAVRAMMREEAMRASLPPALVEAVGYVESRFHPDAVSSKGARGVMQIMPATGASLQVGQDALWDPRTNIATGVRYLSLLLHQYGRVDKALAHYVGGSAAGTSYPAAPEEVRRYVEDVLSAVPQFAASDAGPATAPVTAGMPAGASQGVALRRPHKPSAHGSVLIMRGSDATP